MPSRVAGIDIAGHGSNSAGVVAWRIAARPAPKSLWPMPSALLGINADVLERNVTQ